MNYPNRSLFVCAQESAVWYVEPCGGEGEYHVGRLRDSYEGQPMKWPKAEEIWGGFEVPLPF